MNSQDNTQHTVSFKDTLNLPRTDFPMQAQAKIDDPRMIERWQAEGLYEKTYSHNEGKTKYILHDGPPYANGHIHLGHAYNKILKDIVTKAQRMQGKHVPVKPGWDCHGLPIELKVSQEHPEATPQELKKACRAYAQGWIETQKVEFERLGVLMDWAHPYLTMSYDYEATILRVFGTFVERGYIARKNKTIPWCPSCKTALAGVEIEYKDRKDPSLYVLFELTEQAVAQLFPQFMGKSVHMLVWTTTPWTLPLNRAVLIRPDTEYVILEDGDRFVIVARARAAAIRALYGAALAEVGACSASLLEHARVQHPFAEGVTVPVLLDQSVSLDDGTACVHCAPGCGPEDYETGVRNNLEIFSPVSPSGRYTAGIRPAQLEGMAIADGQIWVIKELAARGRLFHKQTIHHSYPHCWRCYQGLIFRATKQWFCNLSQDNLRQRVLKSIDTIHMVPETSANRLRATMEGRLEWCLSRQRIWGVPIPALICDSCDFTYSTPELIEQVANAVAQEGIEYWDRVVPADLLPARFACPECHQQAWHKEQDILDVWFDSGVSHEAVLRHDNIGYPADLYLEGKDQHRGWFQSSLLTALVLGEAAPMRAIATHGYTVDAQGRKMSKSLGNVVSPQEVVDRLGTDGLRLWVSSIDLASDPVISELLLTNVRETHRKIRNTCRNLLSNVYDFDRTRDVVPFDDLTTLDQQALGELYELQEVCIRAYNQLDFTTVFHKLAEYCSVNLSAFYLDIVKDRLYASAPASRERRSVQTVYWYILDTLTRLMAPILSFAAEQLSDHYQKEKDRSIHLQDFAFMTDDYVVGTTLVRLAALMAERDSSWQVLKWVRGEVLKAIEPIRAQGIIKHSLEATVTLHMEDRLEESLSRLSGLYTPEALKELFIVSRVLLKRTTDKKTEYMHEYFGLFGIEVEHAAGVKCPRCWNWSESGNAHDLCNRCHDVLTS